MGGGRDRGRLERGGPGGAGWAGWACVPGLAWLALFILLPLAILVGVGFLSRGDLGEVRLPLTLESYRRLAGWSELGFDPLYPQVLGRTALLAAGITALTLVAAVPLAYFLAGLPARWRVAGLALIVVPFWTNLLIRTYAWQVLLGPGGPVSAVLAALGWEAWAGALYPGWFAVGLGMFCDFLPFMALPIYASVEKTDWVLAEAAADLGAGRWQVFRHALLPQAMPGIRAGVAMVFLPLTGQFVIPDLLGGGRITLWGNLIQQQFGVSRDWPLGAAAATVVFVALVVAFLGWHRKDDPAHGGGPWS